MLLLPASRNKARLQTENPIPSHRHLALLHNDDVLTLTFFRAKINQRPRKTSRWLVQYVDLCTSDKMVRTIAPATHDNLQLV